MIMDMPAADRVALGALLLDAWKPGWLEKVDLDTLDVNDAGFCILAQVFGGLRRPTLGCLPLCKCDGWDNGLEMLGSVPPAMFGFEPVDREETLDELWRVTITARRIAAKLAGAEQP
jgi:hypothetical protein